MNDILPFETTMIRSFLDRKGIRYLRDDDNGFYAIFGPSGPTDAEVQAILRAEGSSNQIYVIRVVTSTYYSAEDWPRILSLVNRWNCERRFPKAYLSFREGAGVARVVAEAQVGLECGVHQAMIDDFSMNALGCGFQLHDWLREAAQSKPVVAPTADELESWLREAS